MPTKHPEIGVSGFFSLGGVGGFVVLGGPSWCSRIPSGDRLRSFSWKYRFLALKEATPFLSLLGRWSMGRMLLSNPLFIRKC